jgi:hypothetical protein
MSNTKATMYTLYAQQHMFCGYMDRVPNITYWRRFSITIVQNADPNF